MASQPSHSARLAVIDIGTVTARLAVSDVVDGHVRLQGKRSTICNLGEGVDEARMLAPAAIERVVTCVASYVDEARAAGAGAIACTLTSAARDAGNSEVLIGRLQALGIEPQVIPGEVEGRLTFLGVAQDFPGKRLLVADNGGGSTELACGWLSDGGAHEHKGAEGVGPGAASAAARLPGGEGLHIDLVRSTDVGCRRITDRFLSRSELPAHGDLRAAHDFAAAQFAPVIAELQALGARPERLVVTGGTATSLVAVEEALEPYDSSRVHLHTLTRGQVAALEQRFAALTVEERALVPGMQAKRAPVILAGMVAIGELMDQTGFAELTVSESDLLVGLTLATAAGQA